MTLAAGDITLIDAARPCSIVWQQTSRQASLLLPRQRGGAHRGHHYRLPAGQISANGPAQPATAAGKHGRHDALRQRERSRAGGDRLPVAPGAASARSCPSRREKQFQKIIALIDASIQSEHLRPEWLASETGMSVRSLYRLFADQGLVVAQYIKNRRLDLCARGVTECS